jgi:hypothetical protein
VSNLERVPKFLKNSKLSVLWLQHPEVSDPYLFSLSAPASVKTSRRFQFFSGGSGLGQLTGKSREKSISKGIFLASDPFTPLG